MNRCLPILALASLLLTPDQGFGAQPLPVRRRSTIPLIELADQKYRQIIVDREEGQYRVRLMDNHKALDCAYPSVDVLPDGTFVATTYGHGNESEQPYIIGVRFTQTELDGPAKARSGPARKTARTPIPVDMTIDGADANRTGRVGTMPPSPERPRLLVLTDISSLTAGVAEPDDGQSLIRLMLYADEFDIEGLVATSNLGHGQRTRPDLIRRVVDAYGTVRPNLLLHDDRYPPAPRLAGVVKAGQPIAGPKVPVERSVGEGKDTEASEWIIAVVDRPDPRPVWVVIWGGSADLAQALWKVRATRTPERMARFITALRVHAIGDQDATGPWIREQFPNLLTITQRRAFRGMYRGGDTRLVSPEWVEANIHGHGRLGDLYPSYNGGDNRTTKLGRVRGIKEGDTPSFLSLVPNGLSDRERPWLGSWGGRFEGEARLLAEVADTDLDTSGDPDPWMSSVYRWRPAFQADFAARLDWCFRPFAGANHPPVVRILGEGVRVVEPGAAVVLDATGSIDPDGDGLAFSWGLYPALPDVSPGINIEGRDTSQARVVIPREWAGKTIPILLAVTDRGHPKLTRYGRVLISLRKNE